MQARHLVSCLIGATMLGSTVMAGPPVVVYGPYPYGQSAVQDLRYREDVLRDSYKALRQQEEDAWRHARKSAPPQARKHITQEYVARRKAMARDYVARRKALDTIDDRTRDLYQAAPLLPAYPAVPLDDGYRYEQRYSPPPLRYEELPPPPVVIPPPGSREI